MIALEDRLPRQHGHSLNTRVHHTLNTRVPFRICCLVVFSRWRWTRLRDSNMERRVADPRRLLHTCSANPLRGKQVWRHTFLMNPHVEPTNIFSSVLRPLKKSIFGCKAGAFFPGRGDLFNLPFQTAAFWGVELWVSNKHVLCTL